MKRSKLTIADMAYRLIRDAVRSEDETFRCVGYMLNDDAGEIQTGIINCFSSMGNNIVFEI